MSAAPRTRRPASRARLAALLGVLPLALLVALPARTASASEGLRAPARASALLLVTIDTLRADRLGSDGSALGATPRLDRFAAEAEVFRLAFAAAPSTLPSIAALLTGRHPETYGLLDNLSVYPGTFPTLAEHLRERGFATAAVVSNWVLREHCGLARGFDVYDAVYPRLEAHRLLPERAAVETTDAAVAALDRLLATGDRPVFLWVHYQDPHGPYLPPGGHREPYLAPERAAAGGARELPLLADESGIGGIPRYQHVPGHHEAAWYRAGYDGEVAFTDQEVGRLLDAFDARIPRARSVAIVTADHGEGLGESDYWFAHGELLSDPLVRVPLLVRAPGRAPAVRGDVASLVDLVPTLAAALGFSAAADLPGRDLLAPGAEARDATAYFTNVHGARVARHGIATRALRYVVEIDRDGTRERLAVEPPGEPTEALLAAARSRLDAVRPARAATEPATLDADDRQRLRALGYLP